MELSRIAQDRVRKRGFGRRPQANDESESDDAMISILNEDLDYILMNPPYSTPNSPSGVFKLDGFTSKQTNACLRRWSNLLRGQPAKKRAGMAASYLVIARKKIAPGGRIGFVLPRTAAFGKYWRLTREMILRDFENIVVVSEAGYSSEASLSVDTGLGEMLLVATRRKSDVDSAAIDGVVRCVSLHRMPKRMGEAGEIARAVKVALESSTQSKPCFLGEEDIGCVIDCNVTGGEQWRHVGAGNAELALAGDKLLEGKLRNTHGKDLAFSVPMTTIGDIFEVGPSEGKIGALLGSKPSGAFDFYEIQRPSEYNGEHRSLWRADARRQTSILTQPTHRGVPRDEKIVAEIVLTS